MFSNEVLFFGGFILVISVMLLLDLGVFNKKDHVVKFGEAAAWTVAWIFLALVFYVIINTHGDLVHGMDSFEELSAIKDKYAPHLKLIPGDFAGSLEIYRKNMSLEFITGYLLEYALSVDNIFVIILIFSSFGVRPQYYKKVLFWGVLGAIVMRFIFIFLGSALMQRFEWIIYIFGLLLVYQGGKIFFEAGKDEKIDPAKHPVVKFASKYLPVFPRYVREHFFVLKKGKWLVTPLFVVVLIVEFTDLIFAVDSVPAVFSVTKDPYVVFFSNIFAIMGLRSMFFFLSNIMGLFRFLKYGLGVLLVFIGGKMLFHTQLEVAGFETVYSLYVILGILAVSILASVVFPEKKETTPEAIQ
ncbi:TerC/Alx family metal homeostasis membrane protein [Dyadobacter chenwenxiniae]|uniref:TerC/Alx family metal homeostasis membrane protein n=1 Tax=Dyadobacter chenwenxiniae TaxID=2906456 RepID=A0A9X1PI99_9BACT|nr:TerC/Alx family metal homeostasis membrane protein [Dyadobacter chenwenxiniae]MCF0061313.1 TerC/Alx family metal homeostasis membrane protein [Dyadobacter chenwenxiniae]UON81135.1 TerC/Alx family metal homeostasis membrane protein [Dyadobacter chenwenxiniae]